MVSDILAYKCIVPRRTLSYNSFQGCQAPLGSSYQRFEVIFKYYYNYGVVFALNGLVADLLEFLLYFSDGTPESSSTFQNVLLPVRRRFVECDTKCEHRKVGIFTGMQKWL